MKTLLVLVLLSIASYANAGGEIVCYSDGISTKNLTSVNQTQKDFRMTINNDGKEVRYTLVSEVASEELTSYDGSGKIYSNYYGDLYLQGNYELSIPKIPGRGRLTLNTKKGISTANLRCSRTDAR